MTTSYERLGGVINAQWAWHEMQFPANHMLKYTVADTEVELIAALPMTAETLDFKARRKDGQEVIVRLAWHEAVLVDWKGQA